MITRYSRRTRMWTAKGKQNAELLNRWREADELGSHVEEEIRQLMNPMDEQWFVNNARLLFDDYLPLMSQTGARTWMSSTSLT